MTNNATEQQINKHDEEVQMVEHYGKAPWPLFQGYHI
jgi:hypothetical protein